MKKAKVVKVGQVIQFPHHCFDERRSGWNGWIFRAGIVQGFGTSKKTGNRMVKVLFCKRTAGRYQLLPDVEETMWISRNCIFEYDLDSRIQWTKESLEAEANGEEVCWDEDSALLVNNGFVD